MSHNNQQEYFIINSICPHSGEVTATGIFEDMNAVSYRLKRMYTSCGDEYRIECFHLSTAESEAEAYNDQVVSRTKYKKEAAEKEAKLKEYDEWKGQIKEDLNQSSAEVLIDQLESITEKIEAELPNIKAEYQTVEACEGLYDDRGREI